MKSLTFDLARIVPHWFVMSALVAISMSSAEILKSTHDRSLIIGRDVTCHVQSVAIDSSEHISLAIECPNHNTLLHAPDLMIEAIKVEKHTLGCQRQYQDGTLEGCSFH